MNTKICATCNVCEGLVPGQPTNRFLALEADDLDTRILLIDDAPDTETVERALATAMRLLGTIGFTYTRTVRCLHYPDDMTDNELALVSSRCAVWTNQLLESRLLIISTKRGLEQMKVGADKGEGDAFRVGKLGVVLCIPPLDRMEKERTVTIYREQVKRALREVGIR